MATVDPPIIINGEPVPLDGRDVYEFSNSSVTIRLPKLNEGHVQALTTLPRKELRNVPATEIIEFFYRLSRLWLDESYPRRRQLLELGPQITGESPEVYLHSLKLAIGLTATKAFLGDILDSELGSRMLLDEWMPRQNVLLRAEPIGKLFHVIIGNVPVAGIHSPVRWIPCKNINFVKLPARDVTTLLSFVASFRDPQANHPVTKTSSVFYYAGDDEAWIERLTGIADGVCARGGAESTRFYRELAGPGVDVIEYGLESGVQIIRWDDTSAHDPPARRAHDICVSDQEACFSPQIIYVLGHANAFVEKLRAALVSRSRVWPKGQYELDQSAHLHIAARCHEFAGGEGFLPAEMGWMLLRTSLGSKSPSTIPSAAPSTSCRPCDAAECLKAIDPTVQTVGVEPAALAHEVKDELARRGAQRIANIGFVEVPRLGLGHGGKNLDRLLRWTALERERSYNCRIYDMNYDEPIHDFSTE